MKTRITTTGRPAPRCVGRITKEKFHDGPRAHTLARIASVLLTSAAVVTLAPAALAADQLLSGAVTSASGEKLGGVTVSAKLEGSTITTSVYTDETGNYYFPPLAAGKYKVWAQALGFERSNGEVDLSANEAAEPVARNDHRPGAPLAPVARRTDGRIACRRRPPTTHASRRFS